MHELKRKPSAKTSSEEKNIKLLKFATRAINEIGRVELDLLKRERKILLRNYAINLGQKYETKEFGHKILSR